MKSKYMTREVVICATVKYYLQVFVDWNCVNKKFLIHFKSDILSILYF